MLDPVVVITLNLDHVSLSRPDDEDDSATKVFLNNGSQFVICNDPDEFSQLLRA